MTTNWKVLIPVGLVLVLIAIFALTQYGPKAPEPTGPVPSPMPSAPVVESPIAATGNVDDTVSALLQLVDAEQAAAAEALGDAALVDADSQEIADFGQSFDVNEF